MGTILDDGWNRFSVMQLYCTYVLLQRRLQALKDLVGRQELVCLNAFISFGAWLTSNSIFASAMSCSLPPPPTIFCASAICDRTA